jgi:uncharacterized protein YlxW (UPF0749 family)
VEITFISSLQLYTTGNRGFAESKILRRELNLVLSAKISLARVKLIFSAKNKTLGEEFVRREQKKKLSTKNSSPRVKRLALDEEILRREYFLCSWRRNFFKKNHFFTFNFLIINMHLYKGDVKI